jgi:peroxiredoxin family protein
MPVHAIGIADETSVTGAELSRRLHAVEAELAGFRDREQARAKRLSILVLSGSSDRFLAAFSIAVGAAALGIQVTMYFAFWGVAAVRTRRSFLGKTVCERLIAAMLPASPQQANPSQWRFGGLGRRFLRYLMRCQKLPQIEELISTAREMGVSFVCCENSSALMGLRREELMEGTVAGGVATYLESAFESQIALVV